MATGSGPAKRCRHILHRARVDAEHHGDVGHWDAVGHQQHGLGLPHDALLSLVRAQRGLYVSALLG